MSIVSDTWDLERVLTEYLPALKEKLLLRDGKVVIRPDSGNPADIICGVENVTGRERVPMDDGCIDLLWNIFGGTVNSKGYKVLDPHIGLIYGDAITHNRLNEICGRLERKGYAANNIIFGFGSYTYQYVTRDTFGFALKVTHGVVDGKEVFMYKDPKTDKGANSANKKSQKGMCIVTQDSSGRLSYTDQHTITEAGCPENLLRPVFKDGKLLVDEDFDTIRRRLHPDF